MVQMFVKSAPPLICVNQSHLLSAENRPVEQLFTTQTPNPLSESYSEQQPWSVATDPSNGRRLWRDQINHKGPNGPRPYPRHHQQKPAKARGSPPPPPESPRVPFHSSRAKRSKTSVFVLRIVFQRDCVSKGRILIPPAFQRTSGSAHTTVSEGRSGTRKLLPLLLLLLRLLRGRLLLLLLGLVGVLLLMRVVHLGRSTCHAISGRGD